MTAPYTLHVAPHADRGAPDALERAVLVQDGFSWGAFLVPGLWYASHRHWWAALAAFIVVGALGFGLRAAGLSLGATLLVQVLLHLLHGFEGSSIRRWLYERAGRPAVDVVQAGSIEEAELKSFGRWIALRTDPAVYQPIGPLRPLPYGRLGESVIGLFPDTEGRA